MIVPAGAPTRNALDRDSIDNFSTSSAPPGGYLVLLGKGSLKLGAPDSGVTVADPDGAIFLSVTDREFTLDINAALKFGPLANARARGLITIICPTGTESAEVAVNLLIDGNLNPGVLTFNGRAHLQFNDTGRAVGTSGQPDYMEPNIGLRIGVFGRLEILNGFTVAGRFFLSDETEALSLRVETQDFTDVNDAGQLETVRGGISLFSGVVRVQAGLVVNIVKGSNPGLAFNATASARVGFGLAGFPDASADAVIEFNTRSGPGPTPRRTPTPT